MFRKALFIATPLILFAVTDTEARQTNSDIPEWFARHMEYLTQESGIWIADNSEYKSDSEPYEAYGIQWQWGFNKKSIKGRLYGIKEGKDIGSFWEFHTFWHPGENRVIANQYGSDGTFGTGSMTPKELEQTFFNPDGSSYKSGHRSEIKGDTQHSRSFRISEHGEWVPLRFYIWKLQPTKKN